MATLSYRRTDRRASAILVVLFSLAAAMGVALVEERPAEAAVTSVKGSACGYITNVGLFGGPQAKLGCEPQVGRPFAPATANTRSPSVTLPPTGSATPIVAVDNDGAAGVYGPATIMGGVWPEDVAVAPPTGPIRVSTQGTTGPGGSVTSSTDITLHQTPVPAQCWGDPAGTTNCRAPGGFGPPPVWGDALHVECTATETSVSGSATFSNSFVAKATDRDGNPLPSATEAIPTNPPPNYTRDGVITNVGDVFTAVFNEQIINPDGSLTVNAVHMYLFGPVAVGEVIKGQVTCGTTPTTVLPTDTVPPHCGVPVVIPVAPDDPTPKVPREELVGVFDAGGLQSIDNVKVTNGTVRVGILPNNDADPNNDYLKFTQGQTGPLSLVAVRTNESLPMTWSFDATDAAGNTTHCTGAVGHPQGDTEGDYDGNGSADIAVYRPSTGTWYARTNPTTAVVWGESTDVPVPGDYDGNGTTDIAVFRPSNGTWYIRTNPVTVVTWGLSTDIPVPGDYDGNGTTDIAVFRPSNGTWYIRTNPVTVVVWGESTDIPVPGDYDGNGSTDIAVYRPANGTWYIRTNPVTVVTWGLSTDIPVPGDYDGNGTTDIGVYRPSNGTWYLRTNPVSVVTWGVSGDIPVPADFDGNGTTDIGVYRPSNGTWYLRTNPVAVTVWGVSTDVPLHLPFAIRRAYFP